ncbi:FAD-dependent 2-octaprenylphenol hydroxylase [Canicola haemoglobinophilus]|uniref:2-octaprenyl-3-methyl-6-methoxy-1,4-benzoquinol hydroxylase n=1 Tax=Canicola haemoglobinophilus TaxID=733 RepID=A0A1V4B352_9PAST|nr:FAD-dependent monooxygenase [Canicola haemoglobinophilus]OOS01741.1 FAD-dependent 2-octaprenylphenol hydroxylase [Canicola haemoglobinophilus]STO59039.1 2-octaprenyl-3-methyl-6-methoxy-1,4-benzoquinol hydroxylase [Canicola haemoglobinophilus]
MKVFDIAIIGGGMVGLALAASLRNSPVKIAVIEGFPEKEPIEQLSNRVSAINLASEKMLQELGIWQSLLDLRATAYNKMDVWEKDSFAQIQFDTQSLGLSHLGHIIENHLIQHQLWQKVQAQKNVEIITALPQHLGLTESNGILSTKDGQMLSAKLIVGADGANSWLRKQADIPLIFRDYGHHALVCNVKTTEPHENCARQIFAKDSILAFLPLHQQNLCSIVWSLSPQQATALLNAEQDEFNKVLSVAFDNRLGLCKVQGERKTVPLTARYARSFAKNRIALVGDAAHTIHPLAGLGVNLGFQDAIALAQEINKNLELGVDIGEYRYLRHYERWRKTEAVKMLVAMQGLKDLFNGDNPLKKLVRGIGLSTTNHLGFVKEQLIKQALGI